MKKFYSLALTAFLILSSCSNQKSDSGADLVLINGKVWTGGIGEFVQAVAIKGNIILQTGTTEEIKKLTDDHTQIIDLHGKLVTPGFNDAHVHFLGGSMGLSKVLLETDDSIEEMQHKVADFARRNPDKKWIMGRGWQYSQFPGGLPTRQVLDAAVKDRPVFIEAYDGHSAWVNTKALEAAGVDKKFKFNGFGEIVRDAKGEATGAIKEEAQIVFEKLAPKETFEEKLGALRQGMKLASSLGITSIQQANGSVEDYKLYEHLLKQNELTLRVLADFSMNEKTTNAQIDSITQLKLKSAKNPMLHLGTVKFMLDGVIEANTAAMLEPYSNLKPNDPSTLGHLAIPLAKYQSLVFKLDSLGFQIFTHAIGDRAVREALNTYELSQKKNGNKDGRYRIEHIETINPSDLPRFHQLGVLASMEPIHADPGTGGVWAEAIGEKRLPRSFAWKSMLKSNATLVFSSDWPASISLDPIRGLHNAVNRRTIDGYPPEGWLPEQKIGIADALRSYTEAGAYSSFEENIKGKIVPGQLADIIVLSQDLFTIEPMSTFKTKVVMTVFNGQIVFQQEIKK